MDGVTARYSREREVQTFWSRVDRSSETGCWPWLAGQFGNGRGAMHWGGRKTVAYRISWELEHGAPPPSDLFVCHHCDNPSCVRPDHLFLGTCADNNRDMREKRRDSPPPLHAGESHPNATTPDALVREARERYALGGLTALDLANAYGVSATAMQDWLRGRIRADAGGPIADSLVPKVQHGTLTSYFANGCRCEPCRERASEYRRERKAVA